MLGWQLRKQQHVGKGSSLKAIEQKKFPFSTDASQGCHLVSDITQHHKPWDKAYRKLHVVCRARLCAVSDTKDSLKKLGSAIQLRKHGLEFRRPKFKCLLCPVLLVRLRQGINFKFFMWKWRWSYYSHGLLWGLNEMMYVKNLMEGWT